MSLFEFDSGHLVPAQFGRTTAARLESDMLSAVREQVLEIVGRPLFPVIWEESQQAHLLSMDASGQVVTVEVCETLDAATLVAALSRAGNSAALGWLDLASMYPGGQGTFRRDWNEFRESLPPRTPAGPRVVIVADHITDDVRPALELLSGSGIEVYELTLRDFGDGQRLIDVAPVRGPIAARSQMVMLGRATKQVELMASPEFAPVADKDEEPEEAESVDPPAPEPEEVAPEAEAPRGEHAEEPRQPDYTVPLSEAGRTLAAIAKYLGEDTHLTWRQLRKGISHDATLRVSGELVLENGEEYLDPSEAACAVSGREDVNGWRVWRFGEAGPNLDDARYELMEADELDVSPEEPA
ncbi:hypothetical protein BSZ39_05480 [Bowdeniella nasicola]|uniref:RAMA domain-containing protein n=1 Tax=Bowdeniella nasicola TaxID=208480 RepID=A0A1Q5Q2W0_9ACTO|nr:DUF4357 domain-containing protein [Bowdeniella nasicola]OKL54171.1 hypothetical protein BSZ39_05480 [Bowdeniella nasicola]